MSKVICDICGTAYPAAAKNCPICGSSREYALEDILQEEMFTEGGPAGADVPVSGSRKKNKEIFDFDEVNQDASAGRALEEDDFDDDEEDDEEESRTNVGLVIVLVVLIALLLLASGFFFIRYLLPNMTGSTVQTEPVATTLQTEPVETTDPGIPCTNLMVDGGKMELAKDGKKLLNVRVYPENTTDTLFYISGDEAVVTVSEDGTVTAVGEGTTVITIQCGSQTIKCNVTVDYSVTEETVAEGNIPALQVEGDGEDQEPDETQETEASDASESTDAAEETTTGSMELKLKKTDISIFSNYTSITLELDCDIKPEDITWFTMDSTVAIVHDGVVTSTGSGLTRIYGEYEGQQVECIVRCMF